LLFKPRLLSKYDYYDRFDHQSETSEILDTMKANNHSDKFTNIGRNLVKGVTLKTKVEKSYAGFYTGEVS